MSAHTEKLQAEAQKLWVTYDNTVKTGGTPEQRQWAYARAVKADDKAAAAYRAERVQQLDREKRAA